MCRNAWLPTKEPEKHAPHRTFITTEQVGCRQLGGPSRPEEHQENSAWKAEMPDANRRAGKHDTSKGLYGHASPLSEWAAASGGPSRNSVDLVDNMWMMWNIWNLWIMRTTWNIWNMYLWTMWTTWNKLGSERIVLLYPPSDGRKYCICLGTIQTTLRYGGRLGSLLWVFHQP